MSDWILWMRDGEVVCPGDVYRGRRILSPANILPDEEVRRFTLKPDPDGKWPLIEVSLRKGERLLYWMTRQKSANGPASTVAFAVGVEGHPPVWTFANGSVIVGGASLEDVESEQAWQAKVAEHAGLVRS